MFQGQHIVKPVYVLKTWSWRQMIHHAVSLDVWQFVVCSWYAKIPMEHPPFSWYLSGHMELFYCHVRLLKNIHLQFQVCKWQALTGVCWVLWWSMLLTEINTSKPHLKYIRVQLGNPPQTTTTLNAFVYFVRSKTGRVFPGLGMVPAAKQNPVLRSQTPKIPLLSY